MGKPSRCWRRELRKQPGSGRRQVPGAVLPKSGTIANTLSEYRSVAEEQAARRQAVEEQLKVYRSVLPTLLEELSKIRDPRHAQGVHHKMSVLLLYGILAFVFQMASRREANRQMSLPMFQENLRLLFPELESLPHQDTLNRLLSAIEVDRIEEALIALVRRFIRNKKFYRFLVANCYPVAIDGTQKMTRDYRWAPQCLQRQVQCVLEDGTSGTQPQYYVYVLEAQLAFANGMTIPLLSEFLSLSADGGEADKQDCELKAFYRLAARIKGYFPRLPIMVLLDGLYANGPVMELCRRYGWQFMIVLQNDWLPSVWQEARALGATQPHNRLQRAWGDRQQQFRWVNDIEYFYGKQDRKRQTVHLVVCQERWEQMDAKTGKMVAKSSRYAWISSEPLSRENIHERCNLGARHRWGIENSFLVEKRHGYQYEHCFSRNWNAMKGYHFLMHLGRLINILAVNTALLARMVARRGVRGVIRFLRETVGAPWLDAARIRAARAAPFQLRLE